MTMRSFTGLCLAASMALTTAAYAGGSIKDEAEAPKSDWAVTANFGVTSEYIFRGFSQTGRDPAVQGGIDVTYKWFYAGLWASNLDFGKDFTRAGFLTNVASAEVDFYAGIKPVVGRFTFDLGVIYYTYPNAYDNGFAFNKELDYVELKAGVSVETWKDATFGITAFYSPEYTNKQGEVVTVEGAFSQVLPKIRDITPTFSALLAYQAGDTLRYRTFTGNGSKDYLYWNAGLTLGFGDRFSLDFRYWDTSVSDKGGFCSGTIFQCDETFVMSAKVTY